MADAPICKTHNKPKTILKNKKGLPFIGCEDCQKAKSSTAPGNGEEKKPAGTAPGPASPKPPASQPADQPWTGGLFFSRRKRNA